MRSRMLWLVVPVTMALALVAGAVPALQGKAEAATFRTTQGTIPSPPTGAPEVPANVPSARIANKFQGYYIGRVREGGLFTPVGKPIKAGKRAEHRFGRAIGRAPDGSRTSLCGFIMSTAIGQRANQDRPANCSLETRRWLKERTHFGRDFSSKPRQSGQSGTKVDVKNPGCQLHYNYFDNDRLTTGHLVDPAGPIGTLVYYRYRSRNEKVAVVRHDQLGWGFVDMKCINLPRKVYNQPDSTG